MENGEGTYMQNDRFFSLEKNLMGRELFNENNYRAETFFSNITLRCFFRHERPTGISLTYVPEGKNLIFFVLIFMYEIAILSTFQEFAEDSFKNVLYA